MKNLHSWNLSYSQAAQLQTELAEKVQFKPLQGQPELIAGLDCALSKDGQRIIAAAVVLRTATAKKGLWEPVVPHQLPIGDRIDAEPRAKGKGYKSIGAGFETVETTHAIRNLSFPYIPGLLSFREAPVCIAAVEKLKLKPDVFIIDGQGIAHPRRLGLASHLGLFFDKPTIGCAKSRLTGQFEEPPLEKGTYSLLKDKDEVIGAVVRTRTNVEPVFVSVGNKCSLEDAIEVTLSCTTKYRLPEPTRLAHQLVSTLKLKA